MPPTTGHKNAQELCYYKQRGKMPRLPGEDRTRNEGKPIGMLYQQRDIGQNGKRNSLETTKFSVDATGQP